MLNKDGVTVIVPFRNEVSFLPKIIDALEQQIMLNESVEIIWVDDDSEDGGLEIVQQAVARNVNWKCLQREGRPGKKSALHTAILLAQNEFILTTDADCTMGIHWISAAMKLFTTHRNWDMFILPVVVCANGSPLTRFQQVESIQLFSLTALTSAINIPVLCSGANLLFRKSFYFEAARSRKDFHTPSGDDLFLLEQTNKAIVFSEAELVVSTDAVKTWRSVLHQRIRWLGKVRMLRKRRFFWVGVAVGCWQFAWLLLSVIAWVCQSAYWPFLLIVPLKLFVDIVLQYNMTKKLNQSMYLLYGMAFSMLYPLFQLIVLSAGFFVKPYWKGRRI